MKKVYLSGAVEFAADGGIGWREKITPHIQKMGVKVIDPTKLECINHFVPPDLGKKKSSDPHEHDTHMATIARIELDETSQCDMILAKIDKEALRGCGTFCECGIAFFCSKDLILWLDGVNRDEVPGFLFGLYTKIVNSEEEALAAIKEKSC